MAKPKFSNVGVIGGCIFDDIHSTMDEAEGMHGPEDQEYVNLMASIAYDAQQRIKIFMGYRNGELAQENKTLLVNPLVQSK